MVNSLYFMVAMIVIIWLFYWTVRKKLSRNQANDDKSPFAIRDDEEFRNSKGDRTPF